jgi:hypothetical protein
MRFTVYDVDSPEEVSVCVCACVCVCVCVCVIKFARACSRVLELGAAIVKAQSNNMYSYIHHCVDPRPP